MMKSTLSLKARALIGLTLFSMFFGAGNLIFPPYLGYLAGDSTLIAMVGFAITAICFPVLGVMAVANSGGLTNLASRVHPIFASIFTLLIYLSIGPCLAIPRTASTSFEMAVSPFFRGSGAFSGTVMGLDWAVLAQALYSVAFFVLAGFIALDPSKLTQRLGKILGPMLVTLIAILFGATLLHPLSNTLSIPTGRYLDNPLLSGFIDGYQTMDTLAALNFGLVIAMNIRAFGVKDESTVVSETMKAGLIAGVLFVLVYGALAWLGAQSSAAHFTAENGAQTLSELGRVQFGPLGTVILGACFFIACLNTCVGLLSCCSNYFREIMPFLGYKGWLLVFVLTSLVISNAGLTLILKLSVPVLVAIYPVSLVLIVLALVHNHISHRPAVYPCAIALTAITSIAGALKMAGLSTPAMDDVIAALPLSSVGLEWVVPAIVGVALGSAISGMGRKRPIDLSS